MLNKSKAVRRSENGKDSFNQIKVIVSYWLLSITKIEPNYNGFPYDRLSHIDVAVTLVQYHVTVSRQLEKSVQQRYDVQRNVIFTISWHRNSFNLECHCFFLIRVYCDKFWYFTKVPNVFIWNGFTF